MNQVVKAAIVPNVVLNEAVVELASQWDNWLNTAEIIAENLITPP